MPEDQLLAALMAEVKALRSRVHALENRQDEDTGRLALDIAYDRQRITRLEKVEPQPMQRDRADILRALLGANGGKMLAKDARQKMHLSRSRFSRLLSTVKDDIEAKPYHLNKSWQVLVLR
jgi:hypothetical protein